MPVKIGFQVISASGEDERYRATELNYHGPTVRGWRSEVSCTFPQEIILQLKVLTILHKIQILSHQYLIPRKIEICTCLSLHKSKQLQNFPNLFETLGFITFSDNKATGFRSRELKSVFLPHIKAKYVKLIIHNNHINIKNIFNQVSLMGINILGEEVQSIFDDKEINKKNTSCFSCSSCPYEIISNSNYMSPYDDLAFEMYVDEETARIIKKIEYKKHQAIFEEKFDYANTLKLTLENLRAAGEIIGLYEQEKKQAIQFEDYDKAKSKKFQIDNFRKKVYIELHIDEILQSEQLESNYSRQNEDKDKLIITSKVVEKFKNQISIDDYQNKLTNLKYKLHDVDNKKNKFLQKKSDFYGLFKSEQNNNNNNNNNIVQSKSQISFSQQNEAISPTFYEKKTAFSKSLSTPYLNQYFKHKPEQRFQSNYQKFKSNDSSQLTSPIETSSSTSAHSEEDDERISSSSTEMRKSINFRSKKKTCHSKDTFSSPNSTRTNNDKTFDSVVECSKHPPQSDILISTKKLYDNFEEIKKKKNEVRKSESKNDAKNMTKSSFEMYEDSMLPALRNYQKNEIFRECQLLLDKQVKTTLNEREKKQAMLPISVFGIEMVEKFYSKNFIDKEDGLKELQLELKRMANLKDENDNSTKVPYNKIARAALFLLHRTLRDTVYSVYSKAAETIRQFFTDFVPQRVSQAEIAKSVEKLLPELLAKSGDITPRVHTMAAHTLLSISECEEVRRLHIISSQLSRPLTSSVHPRLALSRLEMVEQLMLNQGISKDKRSGLTCRTLAEFGSSGLHHPAEAVRKVSERILLQVYKVNPKIVRKQLPPDDNITRRNLLYRQLFQEFDLMDLKNTSTNNENSKKSLYENKNMNAKENYILISTESLKGTKFSSGKTVNKEQLNSYLQLDTSKCKPFNLSKSIKPKLSPRKSSSVFSSESKNKCQKTSLIKEKERVVMSNPVLFKGNFETKNLIQTINKAKYDNLETKKKLQSNVRLNKNLSVNTMAGLKFPFLTDSIDIATARILLHKDNIESKRELKTPQKKIENNLTLNKTQFYKELTSKKEIRADRRTSNIPISIFHAKKKSQTNTIKKSDNKPSSDEHGIRKNKIKNQTLNTDCESLVKNRFSQIDPDQSQILENTQIKTKHKKNNLKEENINQKINLENKIKMEESYRFSDSMLASIRDNKFMENSFLSKQNDQPKLKRCIFCLCSKKWTKEADLNKHYLNDCPLLMSCEYCMEVVEISGYTNHLLGKETMSSTNKFNKPFVKKLNGRKMRK